MTDSSRAYLTGATSLAASILINGAVFFSVDHAVSRHSAQQFLKFQDSGRKEIVQFEFVETPPVPASEKPRNTKKISDRDSLARDAAEGAKKEPAPKVRNPGRSDQLAQRPGQGAPLGQNNSAQESMREKRSLLNTALTKPRPKETPVQAKKTSRSSGAEMPSLPGQGKILTQETSKARSKGARLYGLTSFEATGSGMGVYMKHLKEKMWANWFPYVAFKFPRDFRGADAVIRFTLDAKGRVKSAKVIESKGTPIFAAFCVEAVERARNFGPLPKEILALTGKDELEISFGFHYG